MASNTVLVKFLANTNDMKKGIADINTQLTKYQKVMKAVGVATAVYFTAKPIINFAKESILAASDLEESIAKVNTVFGTNSKIIRDWAKNSVEDLGSTEQAALEAAGTFGNLFTAFGVGNDQATEMSTTLVQLATDLASFNNTSVEQAINALRSGLSGETEPLKKYGVALNQAAIEAEAMAQGLYDGKGAIDQAAKSMAIYEIVMRQTATAQGDFERTGDGLANQMRKLEAQVEETKTAFGEGFIDALKDSQTTLDDTRKGVAALDGVLEALGRGAGDATSSFASLIPEIELAKKGTEEYAEKNIVAQKSADALAVATSYLAQYSFSPLSVAIRNANNVIGRFNRDLKTALRLIDEYAGTNFVPAVGSGSSASEAVAKLTNQNYQYSASMAYTRETMSEYVLEQRKLQKAQEDTNDSTRGASSGAAKVAKEYVKVKDVLRSIAEDSEFAVKGIKTAFGKVPEATAEAIAGATEVASRAIQAQQGIINDAEQALESYAQKINQSVLGGIGFDLVKTDDGVVDATKSLEQWVKNIAEQSDMVTALSPLATQLPPAITQAIISSGAGKELADALANNPELKTQLTDNYEKLAEDTYKLLSVPMAETFVKIGGESAVDLIDASKNKIKELKSQYTKDVRKLLKVKHTVDVEFNYINPPSSYGGYNVTGSGRSAVAQIQDYERLNGRKWRR